MALSKSIGIKLYDDTFVPVLTEGEVKNKKVMLTSVRDNQTKAIIELFEGTDELCSNNTYLGRLNIDFDRDTQKGEPAIEVHLRLDDDGTLFAKAWDQESKKESEISIEHATESTRIFPETLSDSEIDQLEDYSDTGIEQISDYENDYQDTTAFDTDSYKEKSNTLNPVLVAVIALLIIALLAILGFFIIKSALGDKKDKPVIEQPKEEIEKDIQIEEEPPIEKDIEEIKAPEPKVIEEKEEVTGTRKLEGRKHYIKYGDNLWNICKRYYGDPWYYPDLAQMNGITNPRVIRTGNTIIIPDKVQMKRWDFSK